MSNQATEMTVKQAFNQAYQHQQAGQLQQAEFLYNQILQVQPQFHAAWFQLGLIAVSVNKMDIAAQMVSKAAECQPVEFTYHRALCEIYRRLKKLDKAVNHGKQATKLSDDADSFYNYGLAQKAVELNPKHSEAQHNLGAIYNQRGQIDEAKECYVAAINSNPNFTYAHHSLSTLKKYTEDDPHLEILENLVSQVPQMSHEMQTKFWFALGKARSDVKEYEESFAAYAVGNKLSRQTFSYDVHDTRQAITEIVSGFNSNFSNKNISGYDDETPIFILGMPRSGSTLIEQILDSHSQVHGAGELSDLSEIIDDVTQLEKGASYIDWLKRADDETLYSVGQLYLERLRKLNSDALRIVDKMPGNFFYVGLIHKILPKAKIIHSMRDPMDICISNYTRLFKNTMPFAYDLKELGQYCRLCDDMMQSWKEVLPSDFIFDAQYEDIVDTLEVKAKELINFCGLEWEPSCLDFHKNKRIVKTASQDQVNKPIYNTSVQRWKKYEDYIQPLIDGYGD